MRTHLSRLFLVLVLSVLASGFRNASAQKLQALETKRFRILHEKHHATVAGEILEIAEGVWPTLAKAYESYEHYQRIDILVVDESDDANGFAIYQWNQVAIFVPHMDWVLRNRQIWLRNVVTHELAHVFSLRRASWLSPFDWVDVTGRTYNARNRINFDFSVPWVPQIAPNWWIEGIAQFEAEQHGNDNFDSQRDMLLRDAWLTGTLPTLDYIETFDAEEDWIQGERVYNTGYAFLRYLGNRYGVEKVRRLAFHKALVNFSASVEATFGATLPDLFDSFKRSLDEKYAGFKELPADPVADPAMPGTYQQNLVFSSDGKYMAWLGNDASRRFPANWIYWKPVPAAGKVESSSATTPPPATPAADPATPTDPDPKDAPREEVEEEPGKDAEGEPQPPQQPQPQPEAQPQSQQTQPEPKAESRPAPNADPQPAGKASPWRGDGSLAGAAGIPGARMFRSPNPSLDFARQRGARAVPARQTATPARSAERIHRGIDRSEELGSEGLEFNRENDRLLTTRQDVEYSAFTDIWEYEFKARKSEGDKWRRLTWEERASYPSYHPFQRKIVFVRKHPSGSTNLAVLDSSGRIGQLTNFIQGQQVYNPRYTPRGDSIYFTLQIEDKEAIAVLAADAAPFDRFRALKDTAAPFRDSANLARDQRLVLITPLRPGAIRNLRFTGDTLYWSSNMNDGGPSVYDVYARLPGSQEVVRLTRARTQALDPNIHQGTLYYQGFRRQQFLVFKRPVAPIPTGITLSPAVDTLTQARHRTIDYASAVDTGDYDSPRIAREIIPFLSLQPQFIEDNRTYTDLALGLAVNLSDPLANWTQGFSVAVAKRIDFQTPLNYQFQYSGLLSWPSIRHTRRTWTPTLQYSLYHDIIQYEDEYRERGLFMDGADTIAARATTVYSTLSKRDFASAWLQLPYSFALDGNFFRQRISQDFSQKVVFDNLATGETIVQAVPTTNLVVDANQHRNFNAGLNWGHTWMKVGTYLPTGVSLWGSTRKWWSTYASGDALADSALIVDLSDRGKAAPQFVLTQSRFDPWSLDGGVAGAWSPGRAFTLFANASAGAFLNKFPTVPSIAHISGADTTVREETAPSLWVMTYQLGYSLMPGYPYNFRYRGRDIMEGTSFGHLQYGIDIPIRGLGAFIPGLPTTSFRQFNISAVSNVGTTLINPADRIFDALEDGRHYLLMDFGLRAAANFRLYHQYPFTIYVQGFVPYNHLRAKDLLSEDYPRSLPRFGETPAELEARDRRDRDEYMELVKEPRYFVGFSIGY